MENCKVKIKNLNVLVTGGSGFIGSNIVEFLSHNYSVIPVLHGVYPSMYAWPGIAQFDPRTGNSIGAAFVMSPIAAAVGVD